MIIRGRKIYHPLAMRVVYDHAEKPNGCAFQFEDINPSAEFVNVLSKKDRLQLAWFFFASVFNTRRVK